MATVGLLFEKPATLDKLESSLPIKQEILRERGGVVSELRKMGHEVVAVCEPELYGEGFFRHTALDGLQVNGLLGSSGTFLASGITGEAVEPDSIFQSGRHPGIEHIPHLNPNSFISICSSQVRTYEALEGSGVTLIPWEKISTGFINDMIAAGKTEVEIIAELQAKVATLAVSPKMDASRHVLKIATTSASEGVSAGNTADISAEIAHMLYERSVKALKDGKGVSAPELMLQPYIESIVPSDEYKFGFIRAFMVDEECVGLHWRLLNKDADSEISNGRNDTYLYLPSHDQFDSVLPDAQKVMRILLQKSASRHATAAVDVIPTADGVNYLMEVNSAAVRPTRFNKNGIAREMGVRLDDANARQLVDLAKYK